MKHLIILLVIFTVNMSYAQSTATFAKPISIDNLNKLNTSELKGDIEYLPTKSSRMLVEYKVQVNHPTKSDVILDYIKVKNLTDIETFINRTDGTISLLQPKLLRFKIDGQIADVTISYKVYIPYTLNKL